MISNKQSKRAKSCFSRTFEESRRWRHLVSILVDKQGSYNYVKKMSCGTHSSMMLQMSIKRLHFCSHCDPTPTVLRWKYFIMVQYGQDCWRVVSRNTHLWQYTFYFEQFYFSLRKYLLLSMKEKDKKKKERERLNTEVLIYAHVPDKICFPIYSSMNSSSTFFVFFKNFLSSPLKWFLQFLVHGFCLFVSYLSLSSK